MQSPLDDERVCQGITPSPRSRPADSSQSLATTKPSTPSTLSDLSDTEQKSLWVAFSEARREARREARPIPGAWAQREENIGYDFYALHPKQNLTTRFGSQGVQIVSSDRTYTESDARNPSTAWKARMHLLSFAGSNVPLGAPAEKSEGNGSRVEYRHRPGLTEWYDDGIAGMEHGYTIAQRPRHLQAGEEVVLEVALDGLKAADHTEEDGSAQLNFNEGSRTVLSYSKLLVVDAQGKKLPATMEPTDVGFSLAYHDAQAIYPVTVDPLISYQEQKLNRPAPSASGNFGVSVAISGDSAIIGASRNNDSGNNSGSAYIFTRSGSAWTLQAKLTADDAAAGDNFGGSVAISGDSVVIGAHQDDDAGSGSGSAYIFTRSGSTWSQQAKLTAGDSAESDFFGVSVAISGDSVVIGAHQDDDGGSAAGSAYVFTRSGSAWSQQAKLTAGDPAANDNFGGSVAIFGDSIIIGSHGDDDGASGSGSAYIFTRNGSAWTQQAKLTADDAAAFADFGNSVAISGDSVVIGARQDDGGGNSYGSAYVFTRSGSAWTQQVKLNAGDPVDGGQFGTSVAISGDSVVIGATGDFGSASESAYVFTRSVSTWTQQAKLAADDEFNSISFGGSVAISGDLVIIGAEQGDHGGAAFIFNRSGSTWSQQAKLNADDPLIANDNFGVSVAIFGDSVVIGVDGDDDGGSNSGSAYIFTRTGSVWSQQAKLTADDATVDDSFGGSVAISSDSVIIGAEGDDDGGSNSGSSYIFTRSGSTWSQQSKLNAGDATAGDNFGRSVAIYGDSAVIGARGDDDGAGSAYIYRVFEPLLVFDHLGVELLINTSATPFPAQLINTIETFTFQLTNSTSGPLDIHSISLGGVDPGQFGLDRFSKVV
ncbi:FG-GAP repeat protein, partial [Akkermansiaceae bacterium]|nr:FG-GAP repeat protein [Akkermansiaceae bacterium]